MNEIVIASSNPHKVSEITTEINSIFHKIYSLSDFPKIGEIKEDGNSIRENSFIKSRVTFDYTNIPSLADDTALEVDYLNGDPFVYAPANTGDPNTIPWDNVEPGRMGMGRRILAYQVSSHADVLKAVVNGLLASKQTTINNTYK